MRLVLLFSVFFLIVSSCRKESSMKNDLSGTTWVIWQYKEINTSNPDALNDTLVFLTNNKYTYEGVEQNYSLINSGSVVRLILYGTKFGNVSGIIPSEFNTYGEIIANTFSPISTGSFQNEYLFWIKRI